MRRHLRYLTLGAIVCAGMFVGTAAHAQTPDPQMLAPIKKFNETFNKGDLPGAAATHAAVADLFILDEVAPYAWHGAKAFDTWIADLDADSKKNGITDQSVNIGAPTRVESDGSAAYVVVPSTYSFKEKGVAMRESAQMTFLLKKGPSGWLIHGWTWTGPRAKKAAGAATK
jgi:hypothetical protein